MIRAVGIYRHVCSTVSNLHSHFQRNERVESALAGLETAQYIPPVVRVDDDEEYEDIVGEANSSADSTENSVESESEDLFAQFFTPDGLLVNFIFIITIQPICILYSLSTFLSTCSEENLEVQFYNFRVR